MSILEILDRANWGYRKAGKSIVCRCPFCKNNDLKKDNHDAQVNEDNLYCFSSGKTYGEKDLLELFNLSSVETVEPFKRLGKPSYVSTKETGEPTVVKHNQLNLNDVYKKDVENRNKDEDTFVFKLSRIIPVKLQKLNALYFKLGLWSEGGDTDLTVPVFEDGKLVTVMRRNYNDNKWHAAYGSSRSAIPRRITDKPVVYLASGMGEYIILDMLGFDYICLQMDGNANLLDQFKEKLEGKLLVILPDNDESFKKVIDTCYEYFKEYTAVAVVDWQLLTGSEVKAGYDLRDYIFSKDYANAAELEEDLLSNLWLQYGNGNNGFTLTELTNLVWEKNKEREKQKMGEMVTARFISVKNAIPTKVDFMCKDFMPIPVNKISILSAFGGVGKSWTIVNLAIACINENPERKVLIWSHEDTIGELKDRFDMVYKFRPCVNDEHIYLEDKIELFDYDSIFAAFDLIIFDPLLSFFDGNNENDNFQARMFMGKIIEFARKTETTILFTAHSIKNQNSKANEGLTHTTRGAGAFIDSVRCVYELENTKDNVNNKIDDGCRILKLTKDNYGAIQYLEDWCVKRQVKPAWTNNVSNNKGEENSSAVATKPRATIDFSEIIS